MSPVRLWAGKAGNHRTNDRAGKPQTAIGQTCPSVAADPHAFNREGGLRHPAWIDAMPTRLDIWSSCTAEHHHENAGSPIEFDIAHRHLRRHPDAIGSEKRLPWSGAEPDLERGPAAETTVKTQNRLPLQTAPGQTPVVALNSRRGPDSSCEWHSNTQTIQLTAPGLQS